MLLIFAQLFSKAYGDVGNDYGEALVYLQDGGYCLVGSATGSFGLTQSQALVVKVGATGSVEWATLFGGDNSEDLNDAALSPDNSLYAVGWSWSFGTGGSDFLVARLNPDGSLAWARGYGGGSEDYAEGVLATQDGGALVVGGTYSFGAGGHDFMVLKIDSNGAVEWAKAYGGIINEAAYAAVQTSDGGYLVVGKTASFGSGADDILILRLTNGGLVSWAKVYGGSADDWPQSVIQTPDGGFVVAGVSFSYGPGISGAFLLKIDSQGNLQWAKCFGGASFDYFKEVAETPAGELVAAGWTHSFGAGQYDFLVLKAGADGSLDWCFTFGGDSLDYGYDLEALPDGSLAIFGQTYAYPGALGEVDYTLLKVGPDGLYEGCVVSQTPQVLDVSFTSSTPAVQTTDLNLSPQTASITVSNPAVQSADLCAPLGEREDWCRGDAALVSVKGGLRLLGSPAEVSVFSADGRLVFEGRVDNGQVVFLKPGVYAWAVKDGKRGVAVVRP